MAIKKDPKTGNLVVTYSERHPISRQAKTLKRICNDKKEPIKSKAEARKIYNDLVKQVHDSFKELVIPKWQIVVEEFLESKRKYDWTHKTYENYKICLEANTYPLWGNLGVDEITTEQIRSFIQSKREERSESHAKSLLKFVRGAMEYAVESNYIARNPSPKISFREKTKIKEVLGKEDLRLFLTRAKNFDVEWYPHWATAVYTGMRNGELYALTWNKVDLDNRLIKVDCSWNNTDGFKETKSGDDRMVEIAPPLLTLLKELKLKNPDSHFVLPRLRKWDKGEQARELRLFLMGVGLKPVRFHDLRASWATMMLSSGVEPYKVMAMGGWKDLKTMAIYCRKAGVDIKGITDHLDLHDSSKENAKVIELKKKKM